MKEELLTDLRGALYGVIPTDEISNVLDIVTYVLSDYDLVKKETALVVYNDTDQTIYQRFFIAKAVEGLTQKSLEYYNEILTQFFRKLGKHVKDISTDDVRCYLAYKKVEKLTDNSLNNIRRVLSSFFTWCVAEELIERSPTARIKSIRPMKKTRKPFSEEEMEMLRHSAKSLRNKAIIEFLFSTGCRVSEAVSVNKQDVDFINGKVDVLGKGRKYRTVYLSTRCAFTLKEYLDSRSDDDDALFVRNPEYCNGFIKFGRLSAEGVGIMLRTLGRKAGIDNVHPHRFRRTVATTALKRGMPIEQVQKMLGHSNIQTTTIYAQSSEEDLKLSHSKYVI